MYTVHCFSGIDYNNVPGVFSWVGWTVMLCCSKAARKTSGIECCHSPFSLNLDQFLWITCTFKPITMRISHRDHMDWHVKTWHFRVTWQIWSGAWFEFMAFGGHITSMLSWEAGSWDKRVAVLERWLIMEVLGSVRPWDMSLDPCWASMVYVVSKVFNQELTSCLCVFLKSIKTFIGEEKLKTFINFCLHYIADLDIPVKRYMFLYTCLIILLLVNLMD